MDKLTTKEIHTTIGTITARLVVYRDYIESNGYWRLFWEDVNDLGSGFQDQSTVTGQPFYKTMRAAVEDGQRRHGITAIRADFWVYTIR